MEGLDKVWSPIGGHPMVWHSLAALGPLAERTVLVVRADHMARATAELGCMLPNLKLVAGGEDRQDSVLAGLAALDDVDVIAVHDAARPLATAQLLQDGIDALQGCDGALPVLPLHDTIKRIGADGTIVGTLERPTLRAAQTPQVFSATALRTAHQQALDFGWSSTDDASLLEQAGFRVTVFPGSERNIKVTTIHDLRLAALLLEEGPHR